MGNQGDQGQKAAKEKDALREEEQRVLAFMRAARALGWLFNGAAHDECGACLVNHEPGSAEETVRLLREYGWLRLSFSRDGEFGEAEVAILEGFDHAVSLLDYPPDAFLATGADRRSFSSSFFSELSAVLAKLEVQP
jgi:hypothetical protein